jgi:hypothetical protein
MPQKFIQYEHHGKTVWVDENQKGTHRQCCLCHFCAKFKPGIPEENCPKANLLFGVDLLTGMVTPVFECPDFVFEGPKFMGEPKQS